MAGLWRPVTTACKSDCGMHDLGYAQVYLLVDLCTEIFHYFS